MTPQPRALAAVKDAVERALVHGRLLFARVKRVGPPAIAQSGRPPDLLPPVRVQEILMDLRFAACKNPTEQLAFDWAILTLTPAAVAAISSLEGMTVEVVDLKGRVEPAGEVSAVVEVTVRLSEPADAGMVERVVAAVGPPAGRAPQVVVHSLPRDD